jgi:DnaA family protein
MKQLPLGVRLRGDALFENFAPGCNDELLAALQGSGTSPIWIWGAPGSGKTHLLQALCAAARDNAAYFPLDRSTGLPPDALLGFERSAVLCLDDTDAVAGDENWERTLFQSFNYAVELQTRLVFAARHAPRHAAWRLHDWSSRAASCIVYQLHELDDAGRLQALKLRAAQKGLELPQETAEYLLKRMPRDLRTLLGILDALDDASLVAQRRLTIPFIRAALEKRAEIEP